VSLESLSEADEQLCGPDIVLDLFFVFQGSALFSIMGHLRLLTVLNKYTTNPTMTIPVKWTYRSAFSLTMQKNQGRIF
jgi:hypothetical protein